LKLIDLVLTEPAQAGAYGISANTFYLVLKEPEPESSGDGSLTCGA
jgi:hypothetical protein